MSPPGEGGAALRGEVRAWLERRFPGVEVQPLRQEASTRSYWRLEGLDRVLMVRDDPFLPAKDPYCLTTALFEEGAVRVPAVFETVGRLGLVLLEDCGDVLLAEELEGAEPARAASALEEPLQLLERVQGATGLLRDDQSAFWERLGPSRLAWELRFFHRWWVRENAALGPSEEALLARFYRALAEASWKAAPPVLCHRDFHGRNLLRHETGELVVIDHQDARIGPGLYDLASLLRDPYLPIELPPGFEEEVLARWARRLGMAEEAARRAFEQTALQRNLKAAGTYAYQVTELGREIYRPSLAPTLRWARRAFEALPEAEDAFRVLEEAGALRA